MDYIYSKLNKQVETATYQGRTTSTAEVIVDNINYVVSVNVLDIPQYYLSLITKLRDDIDVEVERAMSVEQSLSRNLNAEITRAYGAETQLQTNLNTEILRATTAEEGLTTDLNDETERATTAEQAIQANVTQLGGDLAAERTRATNAEIAIASNLSLEQQRATTRENGLEQDFNRAISDEADAREQVATTLQQNISAEQTRASNAEDALSQDIQEEAGYRLTDDAQLKIDIKAEEERAQQAEATLQQNITTEAETRLANDNTLQLNITQENTRATQKESDLQSDIDTHIASENNPHNVTKAQVGLTNVDNTSDIDKPVSTAAQQAIDAKLDKNNANQNITKDVSIAVEGDNVYTDVTYVNLDSNTQTGPTRRHIPLADADNAGLMATADYSTLYDLKDRVEGLEGKTTRLLYTAGTNPTAEQINSFVIAAGYASPFEGVAVVIDETYHIWHFYENDNIGWRDDGLDTTSTFTNTTEGVIKGSTQEGKVFAETDGTGSVNGWGSLVSRVGSAESGLTEIGTNLTGVNSNLNKAILDIDNLENRVYSSTSEGTATATTVEPNVPAAAEVTVTYDSLANKTTYAFGFDIPKGEIGDAECTEDISSTGVVNYTVQHETDKTFTSDQITALNLTIPAQMFHGFYAGVNFRTGVTPPTFTVTGAQGLAYPIKKLKRSGVQVQTYELSENSTELVVIVCDGINVYCNLMEVN